MKVLITFYANKDFTDFPQVSIEIRIALSIDIAENFSFCAVNNFPSFLTFPPS